MQSLFRESQPFLYSTLECFISQALKASIVHLHSEIRFYKTGLMHVAFAMHTGAWFVRIHCYSYIEGTELSANIGNTYVVSVYAYSCCMQDIVDSSMLLLLLTRINCLLFWPDGIFCPWVLQLYQLPIRPHSFQKSNRSPRSRHNNDHIFKGSSSRDSYVRMYVRVCHPDRLNLLDLTDDDDYYIAMYIYVRQVPMASQSVSKLVSK